MWTPDRSSCRPPTGLRSNTRSFQGRSSSSVASLGKASYTERSPSRCAGGSSASVDTNSFHSAFADAEDDSSCDDTYVSMTSNRSNRRNIKESLFEQSPRILKETTKVTNTHDSWRSPTFDKKKKNDYSKLHTISRAESSGILDKLKSDINSLEILRKSSYAEETVFSGSTFDFHDENQSKGAESLPTSRERTRSVDRSLRQHGNDLRGSLVVDTVLQGKYGSGAASLDGSRRFNLERNHNELRDKLQREKMEIQAKFMNRGHDMEIKLKQKDEEISRLTKEFATEKEQNDRYSTTISELQSKLDEYKSKEVATQNALRDVMKNVEHERDVRDKEIQLASRVQQAEVLMLEEKLNEAHERIEELKKEDSARHNALRGEISEKSCIIDGLKRDINHLRSLLDNSTRSKADGERTLRNKIERLEMRLDEQRENENKRVAELNEKHESSEEEWMEKLHHLESRLEEQNTREAEWNEELSEVRRELEEMKSENSDLKKVAESMESLKILEHENEDLKRSIESTRAAADKATEALKRELDESNKANSLLARQLESMKEMELERDEYVSKIEKSLANEDSEKREHNAKIEQLQQDLAESKLEHDKLKAALEKSKEATAEANAQLHDAVAKLDRLINEKRELTKRINELEAENLKLASEMSYLETKVEHEKNDHSIRMAEKEKYMKDLEQAKDSLDEKIDELKNETESYKDQLAKVPELEATIKDMKSTLEQSEDKYITLQSKLRSVNVKFEESEKNYEELEKKYKTLKREQSELQERGESYASGAKTRENELMERIQRLKAEKNDAVAEIEELKEEVAKSKKELSQARDEAKGRNDQLRTALESLDEMMKYIDSMKEESDDMIKALESETEGLMKR